MATMALAIFFVSVLAANGVLNAHGQEDKSFELHEGRSRPKPGTIPPDQAEPDRNTKPLPYEPRVNTTWLDVASMQLDAVTLMGSGEAELTRSASVDLGAQGIHQVVLWNMTRSMVPNTARIAGSSASAVMVLELAEGPSRTLSLEEDNAKLDSMAQEISALEMRMKILEEQSIWLAKTTTVAAEKGTWKDIQDMEKWRLERLLEVQEEISKVQEEHSAKSEKRDALLHHMRVEANRKQISVDLQCGVSPSGAVRLELSYRVRGASWSAEYDLLSSPGSDNTATLTYFGKVQQNTGEDWNGAALTLSTSSAEHNIHLPEVHPHVLSLTPAGRPNFLRMSTAGVSRMSKKASVQMEADGMEESAYATAEASVESMPLFSGPSMGVLEGATGVMYVLPHRTNLPSDGRSHRLFIGSIKLSPSYFYASAPRLEEKAYLLMKVKNPSQYTLLAGPVTSIVDGSLAGTSHLSLTAPQEEFELPLGVDDAVRVKVIPATKLDSKLHKSLFSWSEHGDRSRRSMAHVMTIENRKAAPVKIRVKDVLPTVSDEAIKVELTYATKDCTAGLGCTLSFLHEEETGKTTWDLELPASGEQRLQLKFSVDWPKDQHPSGLDMAE